MAGRYACRLVSSFVEEIVSIPKNYSMTHEWCGMSVTRLQEGIEEPLGSLMGEQAFAKIVSQREVKARIRQLEAQSILPIDATTHRISGLAIRESFDILHHHDQRQAPGCDLDRMPPVGLEIGKEVLRIERAKLGPQV